MYYYGQSNATPSGCVINPTVSNRQARPYVKIGEEYLSHLSTKEYMILQQQMNNRQFIRQG